MDPRDLWYLANNPWPKHEINNICSHWTVPPSTFEFVVETMPSIPEETIDTFEKKMA